MLSLFVLCLSAQPSPAVTPEVRAKLEKVITEQQLGSPLSEHALALPIHKGAARYLVPVRNTWLSPPVLNLYVVGKGSPKPIPDPLGKGDASLVFVAVHSVELRSEAGEDRVVVTVEYQDKKKAKVVRSATYKVGDKLQRLEEGAAPQVTVLDTSCRSQPLPFKASGKVCPAADGGVLLSLTSPAGKVHTLALSNDGIEEVTITTADARAWGIGWEGAECSAVIVMATDDGRRIVDHGCQNSRSCQVVAMPTAGRKDGVVRCQVEGEAAKDLPFSID
jgi:hypothetical protein